MEVSTFWPVALLALTGCASTYAGLPSTATVAHSIPTIRDVLKSGGDAPELVLIRAGKFRIGEEHITGRSAEEATRDISHEISIAQAFAIGRFEVTVKEFRQFVSVTNYLTDAELSEGCSVLGGISWREPDYEQSDRFPVVCVSWNDAQAYVTWLSEQTGWHYRLPTEAEWEYTARGGTRTRYWWGDEPQPASAHCWECVSHERYQKSMPVGSFAPNDFGVYDTAGNVWEWTASEYAPIYTGAESQPSARAPLEGQRVVRGGSWFNGLSDLRSAYRGVLPPHQRYISLGFRVLREVR